MLFGRIWKLHDGGWVRVALQLLSRWTHVAWSPQSQWHHAPLLCMHDMHDGHAGKFKSWKTNILIPTQFVLMPSWLNQMKCCLTMNFTNSLWWHFSRRCQKLWFIHMQNGAHESGVDILWVNITAYTVFSQSFIDLWLALQSAFARIKDHACSTCHASHAPGQSLPRYTQSTCQAAPLQSVYIQETWAGEEIPIQAKNLEGEKLHL